MTLLKVESLIVYKERIMKRVIEIRAAEGGEDSKLFVGDLAQAYTKLGMKLG